MRIVGTSVEYTTEDDKGFVFSPMDADTYTKYTGTYKRKRKIKVILLLILLLIGAVLNTLLQKYIDPLFFQVYMLAVLVILGIGIQGDSSNLRLLKKGEALTFEVKVVKKYSPEDATSLGAGDIVCHDELYPILARDTTSAYESILYIPKDQYDLRNQGDTITLDRFRRT